MKAQLGFPTRLGWLLLSAPALIALLGLVALPLAELVALSLRERVAPRVFTLGWVHYRELFDQPQPWQALWRTLWQSALVTAIALGLAFPMAWTVARQPRGGPRSLMLGLCLLPLGVGEVVRVLGWAILLREAGALPWVLSKASLSIPAIDSWMREAAALIARVYSSLLFMLLALIAILDTVPATQVEAARDLGGGSLQLLRGVLIPHAAPGAGAACVLVFMLNVSNGLAPMLSGERQGPWFTALIDAEFILRLNWEQGAALGMMLLGGSSLVVSFFLVLAWASRRAPHRRGAATP